MILEIFLRLIRLLVSSTLFSLTFAVHLQLLFLVGMHRECVRVGVGPCQYAARLTVIQPSHTQQAGLRCFCAHLTGLSD